MISKRRVLIGQKLLPIWTTGIKHDFIITSHASARNLAIPYWTIFHLYKIKKDPLKKLTFPIRKRTNRQRLFGAAAGLHILKPLYKSLDSKIHSNFKLRDHLRSNKDCTSRVPCSLSLAFRRPACVGWNSCDSCEHRSFGPVGSHCCRSATQWVHLTLWVSLGRLGPLAC